MGESDLEMPVEAEASRRSLPPPSVDSLARESVNDDVRGGVTEMMEERSEPSLERDFLIEMLRGETWIGGLTRGAVDSERSSGR